MSTEKIISAIPSLSGFDMLEQVRSHNVLGDVFSDVMPDGIHGARADAYSVLPPPNQDAVVAFEVAMQTSQYVVPVPHTQNLHFTDTLAMADAMKPVQDGVVTQNAVHLPSPDTLLAEGVRQLQVGDADSSAFVSSQFEPAQFAPSWMEAVPKAEVDAYQRGLENLDSLLHSVSAETISQKGLLQLQFAMEEISVYKEIGIQISQKSASNIESVLKQSE